METALLLVILVLVAASYFRRNGEPARKFKTLLVVNVDSSERDQYDLPSRRIQFRKTVLLAMPPSPGVLVEPGGTNRPKRVLEVTIGEDLIAAHLEAIVVPVSAVDNEASSLSQFGWHRQA